MKLALPVAVLTACLLPLGAQTAAPAASAPTAAPSSLAETQNPTDTTVPPPPANPAAHSSLTGNIMEALVNTPSLGLTPITISVTDQGAVSLNGVVNSQAQLDEALKVVKAVPGVKTVSSQILVDKDPFASAAAASVPAPAPATASMTSLLDTGNDPQSKLDEALSAQADLARVASNVYANKVTLFGTVSSSQAKKQAEEIARKTLPDFKLSSIIFVSSKPSGPDPLVPHR